MQLDDPAGDREPEAGAATVGRTGLVGAVEALEDPLDLVGRDARPLVADGDPEPARPPGDVDANLSAFG